MEIQQGNERATYGDTVLEKLSKKLTDEFGKGLSKRNLERMRKFKIGEKIYDVKIWEIIEIPPNTEFVYIGQIKLLLIMNPAFDPDNSIDGKVNDLY